MGIFSRVRDIISSNINAMLDRAEDPEKLVRLMIQEMEDTLVEVKASCAGAMANKKKVERELRGAERRAREWDQRARLAVDKGREDLAREALVEKRRWQARRDALYNEAPECDTVIEQYQDDIRQLEDKLNTAREKQRMLIQRHIRASKKRRAQQDIRRLDTTDAWMRFEQFENRIERMEAEGELVNYGRKPNLDDAFAHLEFDEEIEKELAELRRAARHENDQNESVTPYEG
jgi:phage shock protein A